MVTLALAGHPNCGKSTLFNAVAGFKAHTSNFHGTTVAYTASDIEVEGQSIRLVDLPGTYSLSPRDAAEQVTRDTLLTGDIDAIIAVVDASALSRSLELLLQVLEVGAPVVIALNLVDEAERRGIAVDVGALESRLGLSVVPTVAHRGTGAEEVVRRALRAAAERSTSRPLRYDDDVEAALAELEALARTAHFEGRLAPRFVALRLLEGDERMIERFGRDLPELVAKARSVRRRLAEERSVGEGDLMPYQRHARALALSAEIARPTGTVARGWRDRLDQLVLHPFGGIALALLVFAALFLLTFLVGGALSELVAAPFDALNEALAPRAAGHVGWALLKGIADGVGAGVGIVLPYLLPLLLVMTLLEDVGYLPRAAYLLDGLLRRVGLSGKSVVPLILGYGCNVPALMATRVLDTPRDRLVTALLVPLIPCSARTVVILALVAGLLGPLWALAVYAINLIVVGLAGRGLAALRRGGRLPVVMDVPPYRIPTARGVAKKVWFRIYQFLASAWPILVVASIALALLEAAGVDRALNGLLRPLTTGVLGLPEALGVTLFFGVLRKELALLMLFQALGTTDVLTVLTPAQVVGFTLFVTFYVPCVATVATLVREVGWRWTAASAALSTAVAVILSVSVRLVAP